MRRMRVIVAGIAVAVLMSAWAGTGTALAFTDVPEGHRYAHAINELAQLGIVSGKGDGTFRPDDPVYRAQFAKMTCGLLEINVTEDGSFEPFVDLGPDDPDDLYPHEFVGAAYRAGITKGKTATTFSPYTNISLAQVVTMVVRAADAYYPGLLATPPADWYGWWADGDPTHGANVRRADYTDLLAFLPIESPGMDSSRPATRGEVSQILVNLLQKTDGKWDKSNLSLADLYALVQAERPYDDIYLPQSLPAGWAIADPYQVGPFAGFVDANPHFVEAAMGYRTGYYVTFTTGDETLSIMVDPEQVEYEVMFDWDSYENPVYKYLGIYLDGAQWQLLYTDTLALTYVEPHSDVNPDGFCGVYIWSSADQRPLALDFASRIVLY